MDPHQHHAHNLTNNPNVREDPAATFQQYQNHHFTSFSYPNQYLNSRFQNFAANNRTEHTNFRAAPVPASSLRFQLGMGPVGTGGGILPSFQEMARASLGSAANRTYKKEDYDSGNEEDTDDKMDYRNNPTETIHNYEIEVAGACGSSSSSSSISIGQNKKKATKSEFVPIPFAKNVHEYGDDHEPVIALNYDVDINDSEDEEELKPKKRMKLIDELRSKKRSSKEIDSDAPALDLSNKKSKH